MNHRLFVFSISSNKYHVFEIGKTNLCLWCLVIAVIFSSSVGCDSESENGYNNNGESNDGVPIVDSGMDINACPDCCSDSFPRGEASNTTRLVAAFTPSPEGVAVCPNGDVFLAFGATGAGKSEIKRVPLDGSAPELWSTITGPLVAGITCDDQGRLFVAQFSGTPAPSTIIMVSGKDDPGTRLPGPFDNTAIQTLNGIIAIKGLGVYASDTMGGMILRAQEIENGVFEVMVSATDVVGANGLAYDSNSSKLYVGLSTTNKAGAIEIGPDGSLSAVQEIWTGPDEPGFVDGTAVDEQGRVYVAYWLTGKVIRISDNQIISSTISNPASLAFRGGILLVTDYKLEADVEGGLYAIDVGVCGATTHE